MFGNNNSNVFGQLNQNLNNKPAFNFGSSTQPAQQQQQQQKTSTFVFGATSQNEVKQESNKLNSFNFGSQQPAVPTSNFNFNATPKTENFATPHKPTTTFGTPSASPAPFVFGGAGGQSTGIDTNFQQSLTPSVNSSTTPRLIKKPTRRLKK